MRIAIATDAWKPQVNGVVTTLGQTRDELIAQGHEVLMITPESRRSIPCPTYPEIRLTLFAGHAIANELDDFDPDCVHIATEAPIGMIARRYCMRRGLPFTTAYHTQFPEYVRSRFPVPLSWTISLLRWFHAPATRTLVPTASIKRLLEQRGFRNVVLWSRGVSTDVFNVSAPVVLDLPRPIWMYAGRVAVEKNIARFLELDLPGSKVVIGDGPDTKRLRSAFSEAHFLGYKFGRDLAAHLAAGDVFVFPSRTDTFGIVMLEAMACGLPVAAHPVAGPVDVVLDGITGYLDDDLARACARALTIDRNDCIRYARSRSWTHATAQFLAHLAIRTRVECTTQVP
jgi:1,2-diacylglycerol 3-alpha-glucosyltransferase/glucuronosyltransferase